jgi:hypothetical protein
MLALYFNEDWVHWKLYLACGCIVHVSLHPCYYTNVLLFCNNMILKDTLVLEESLTY